MVLYPKFLLCTKHCIQKCMAQEHRLLCFLYYFHFTKLYSFSFYPQVKLLGIEFSSSIPFQTPKEK
jgi:hypothetical protein